MRLSRRGLHSSVTALAASGLLVRAAQAQPAPAAPSISERIAALVPELERRIAEGMAAFDAPGLAVGIVAEDKLVYARGFGVRDKQSGAAVGPGTVFQIGSTTKAFLAAALAIAVDRGKLAWNDRIVDLDPSFALMDPYVTRELRLYDIIAQRSGLPPYANDALAGLGFGPDALMHSLRFVPPASSFRSTFTYTNMTHLFAGRIAAKALGAPDWPTLADRELIGPLGMSSTSFTAAGLQNAPDHATGYGWSPLGATAMPIYPPFYEVFGPAGGINSCVTDCASWLRLQIADGVFAGRRIVSAENLGVTRTPRVPITETFLYAMGWLSVMTPNGRVIFHNGGTGSFGAHIGFLPDRKMGMVVLTNLDNKGLPDALGLGFYDRLLGNPDKDHIDDALGKAKAGAEKSASTYERPAAPQPPPQTASLVGGYASEMMGPAAIAQDGDTLVLTVQRTGARLRLTPFDGATFTMRVVDDIGALGGGAPPGSRYDTPAGFAGFEIDGDGRLARLRMPIAGQDFIWTKA
ncbi:MAG TPA: serine hydrolase domain-containing protein [Acetobacteraceae bacterium]|nr:serine hydrolase domain-containing protein [Acetobacteraceae bacterium]